MASQSNWISIINGLNDAFQWSSYTAADIKAGKNKNGIVQKYTSSDDGGKYFYSPSYKSVGHASSGGSDASSVTDELFAPVRIRAKWVGNKIVTQGFVGRVMDSSQSDTMIRAGIIMAYDYEVVMAVAAICGYSIGKTTASDIVKWLNERNFDWGPSSVSNSNTICLVGVPSGNDIKTFIEDRLVERLIYNLNMWGLWKLNPSGITPLEPVIGEMTEYDFRGRFPAVPDKWVEPLERVINEMVNPNAPLTWPTISPDKNWYMQVIIQNDGTCIFYIFGNFSKDTNIKEFTYRSPKMNGEGTFRGYATDDMEEQDIIIKLRAEQSFCYVYSWKIQPDGDMNLRPRMENYAETTWYFSKDENLAGVVYDNFGYYRPITEDADGKIKLGAPTDELSQVVIDPNAIDLRTNTIPAQLPKVWSNRIYASSPNFDQEWRGSINTSDLNESLAYLQLRIPKGIDANSTQDNSFWGITDTDLVQRMIDDVKPALPQIGTDPSPVPVNPPSVNPVVPTLPQGANMSGLVHLYALTGGDSGQAAGFRQWLWSLEPTIWKAIMQNPMDAVIGFHAIFASPKSAKTVDKIILGNLECDVPSVSGTRLIHQYNKLECGGMLINPYFKNINDIVSTKIQLFLPFIGFVDINSADVFYGNKFGNITGKYLFVDYYIDFMTGACIACISTKESKDDSNDYLYQYAGNCSVQIPITGADYTNIVRNAMMVAGGGAVGFVSGLSSVTEGFGEGVKGALSGAVEGISGVNTNTSQIQVQRSGSIGSNAGAMGVKKPYLVITRTVSFDAENRRHFDGLPQNMNVRLSAMSGYTRVKLINLEGLNCTEEEKDDILAKLQGGVFI